MRILNSTPAPRRVEWSGPEGWTVWADEDGVHIRAPRDSGGLEQPDALRLIQLYEHAREAGAAGSVRAPAPPCPTTPF